MPDPEAFSKALGLAMRERRLELGLSQEALAARIGFDRRRVHDVENHVHVIRADTLARFAAALDMAPSAIVSRAETIAADLQRNQHLPKDR